MIRRAGNGVAAGLGLVVGLAVVGAGCGSGTSTSSGTTAASASGSATSSTISDVSTTVAAADGSFSVLAGEGVPVDLQDLAANLEDRLVAAGQTGTTVQVDGDRVSVDPGDGPLDVATLEDLVSTPGRLEMRPVLGVLPPDTDTDCAAAIPTGGAEEVGYPEVDESGTVIACYWLGPTGLTNDAIEDAAATLPGPQWVVNLVFTPDGIDAFNALAGECHARSADCPTGQLALAVDGIVVSAPTINQPSFERDQIQISGSFTESEAKALAAALRVDPLPTGLEVTE